MVSLGFIGLLFLDAGGLWKVRQSLPASSWFFPIVAGSLILNTVLIIKRREWIASLRMAALAKLEITVAFLTPFTLVFAAIIWEAPYKVAIAQLVILFAELFILLILPGYDLDAKKNAPGQISLRQIFHRFWRYSSVTYLIFIFNSFVFGMPLTIFLLAELGVTIKALGLITVTMAIVHFGTEIANIPLANLRVPIMARMVAEDDHDRFLKMQRIMTSILVITSSFLAITMLTLAPPILRLMYGDQYSEAITWGVPIAVIGLSLNFFSMGNSTIRQVQKYVPVIVGLSLSLLFIILCNVIGVKVLPEALWPPLVVFVYVVGRGIFLLVTDLWTDSVVFQWRGTFVKVRGLVALGCSIFIAHGILHFNHSTSFSYNVLSFILAVVIFLASMKLMGGVGEDVRKTFLNIMPLHLKWAARVL